MSTIRFRPTFCLASKLPPTEAKDRVHSEVQNNSDAVDGQFKDQHAVISIVKPKRHFWSPWLSLEIRESQSGSEVFGRFSPHPSIWTAFIFAYLALGLLVFFSGIVAVSQQLASQTPTAYSLVPIWFCIAIALWLISQAGQKLAMEEIEMMQRLVQQSVGDSIKNGKQDT